MHIKRIAIISCLLVVMYFSAVESISTSNLGREFYVGFLDNYGTSGTTALYIAAFEPTNVKIYSQMSGFTTISFFITTGDVKYIPFPATFMTINSASYNTYYIQADKGISVIGLNSQAYTSDGFLAFPVDIPAPTSFRLITYSANSFGSNMGIVASDDNTEITISYSPNAGVSSPTSITLNRMQGYQIQASGDLTGTSITSTKPISVYSGNRCANVPLNAFACDNIVEQMMPIATWGTEFNTVSIPTRTSFDVFRAVANEDSTSIYIDGVLQTTIDAGSFYEFQVTSGNYDVISSDKIISLAQFCVGTSTDGVISDPFMTIIPPSAQYISRYFFTTPIGGTAFANYLSIVIESDYSSGLLFDESPLSATWNTIGSGSYVGTSLSITPGAHSLTHTSATVQFSVQLAGFGSAESYGYPGGIRLAPIALPCIQTTTVIDDGIDNDCDGKIDEELPNGVDDDGDGLIDEDLVSPNCEDGNICTTDFFDGTQCTSTPLDCSDGNPCTTDTCDESSGCQHTPIADGGSCILDDLCYTGSCQSGTCAKTPITCDDNNPCTSNSCDSSVGCVFSAISGGECTDNNACTEYDTCDEGVCVGTQISCGEDTQCLKYRCDATTGCYSTYGFGACQINACEFGRCNSGVCDYVGSVNCDDNNPCTDDTCDDESGCNNLYNNENTCYSEQCNQVTTCHYGECTSKSIEVDRDCDFVPECLDRCKGVDDRVDNDHDGNIDCLSPPTEYNQIYPAWKCNIDRAYVCSVIKTQSKCISWSDVASYVESGDYLFGKCYSACRSNS